MKKIDIIISLVTGFGVGILFAYFAKDLGAAIPFFGIILPIFLAVLSVFLLWLSYLVGKRFIFVFQLAKFVLIGALFALFDLVILDRLLQWYDITEGAKYSLFVGVSFIIATAAKYVFDKYWAFEKKEGSDAKKEFIGFFVVTILSGFIQIGIATFVVNVVGPQFGMSKLGWAYVGKLVGIVIASAWNFIGYKFIIFKK